MELNLTEGNIYKQLIHFSLPCFLSYLLQSFYNATDIIVIGQFVDSNAIVAISSADSIIQIINSICVGLSLGGSVLVAQYKGAKNYKGQKKLIISSFYLFIILSLIAMVLILFLYKPILSSLSVPIESLPYAYAYITIVSLGFPFLFGFNVLSGIFQGIGDAKKTFYLTLISAITNAVLDLLFVILLHLGIKGIAIATIVSQAITFFVSLIWILKKDILSIEVISIKDFKDYVIKMIKIGLPISLQKLSVSFSFFLLFGIINAYGCDIATSYSIGIKIILMCIAPSWAICTAITIMVGQNIGSVKIQRVKLIVKKGLILNIIVIIPIIIAVYIFAKNIILIFDKYANENIIYYGSLYLKMCIVYCVLSAIMRTYNAFAAGIGKSSLVFINSLIEALVVRFLLSYILGTVLSFGFIGICGVSALSPLVPSIIGFLYFRFSKWDRRYKET